MLLEQFWVKPYISGFVDSMHVSESRGDREVGADWGQSLIDGINVFGLRVQGVVVYIFVVDTVFFTTSDTDFLHCPSRNGSGQFQSDCFSLQKQRGTK